MSERKTTMVLFNSETDEFTMAAGIRYTSGVSSLPYPLPPVLYTSWSSSTFATTRERGSVQAGSSTMRMGQPQRRIAAFWPAPIWTTGRAAMAPPFPLANISLSMQVSLKLERNETKPYIIGENGLTRAYTGGPTLKRKRKRTHTC
jgi:hypothetical protein